MMLITEGEFDITIAFIAILEDMATSEESFNEFSQIIKDILNAKELETRARVQLADNYRRCQSKNNDKK